MQKRNTKFLKPFIFIVVVFFAITVIFKSLSHLLRTADFFKIKNISVTGVDSSKLELDELKGLNTFEVDLKKVSHALSQKYPSFYQISVTRQIPDELSINFKERYPVARVRIFNKHYLVDDNGVLINLSQDSKIYDNLPIITGLETSIHTVQPGKQQDCEELTFVLDLIKNIGTVKGLKEYNINSINAATLDNLSFFIQAGPEIKIERAIDRAKLNLLPPLLEKLKPKLDTVKYIDLRFKDPIIKTK